MPFMPKVKKILVAYPAFEVPCNSGKTLKVIGLGFNFEGVLDSIPDFVYRPPLSTNTSISNSVALKDLLGGYAKLATFVKSTVESGMNSFAAITYTMLV